MKTKYIFLNLEDNYFIDEEGIKLDIIRIKNKINIFAGENNSGKSRLFKLFLNKKNKSYIVYGYSNDSYLKSYINNIAQKIDPQIFNNYRTKSNYEIEMSKLNILDKYYFSQKVANSKNIDISREITAAFPFFVKDEKSSNKYLYIPTLRGNENFDKYFPKTDKLNMISMTIPQHEEFVKYFETAKTIYKNKVSNVYGIDSQLVFTAEELYDEITEILLGKEEKRKELAKFEKFIDEMFYEGKGFHINPSRKDNCLLVRVAGDSEYELHNLGEGIKQLITILYPIYMNKDKEMYFFIEEPEINLHPGFQRKLMEILSSNYFPHHTFFITTHSNHIMDIINYNENISIFKVNKEKKKIVIKELDREYLDLLDNLGVNASATLLSNCSIWVEGISDRIYIKKYLEEYFKHEGKINKYKEGIHYTFVEHGGANLSHWNFDFLDDDSNQISIKYLSHNAFLIVDNDNTKNVLNKDGSLNKKEQRKKKLAQTMGKNFYELKSREIENLIKLEILEKTLKADNGTKDLERIKYLEKTWQNRFEQSLISNPNTYMGEFIDSTYKLNKKYSATNSKTIREKADFARKICSNIEKWEDLSEQAQELATAIGRFIIDSNNK